MPALAGILAAVWLAVVSGCGSGDSLPDDGRTQAADEQVRAKWGKPLDELPTATLAVISPHNENIRNEFQWAFSLHHAVEHGQKVVFEWRTVGGGSGTIFSYLREVYSQRDSSGIDILWGGGEFNFIPLAREGIFQPMSLAPDVLANIPETLGSARMYDPNLRWIGAAVSAFGYLYNVEMLRRCRIAPPDGTWDDLADRRFADLIVLADPTQSGSAAAAYQMIVRSGESWPAGWGKLLLILANAKRFTDSAGTAANAPGLGEALVATAIDFYGAVRVAEAPSRLVYVSPRGQTAFTPDPIAILKNPPHPQLAKRFIDFCMSAKGQALWALRVGEADGPVRSPLGRQPIRRDVYDRYAGRMIPSIVNPFEVGQAMSLEGHRGRISYGVLRELVRAAAVDNTDGLRSARDALVRSGYDAALLAEFQRLPDDADTLDKMAAVATGMKNKKEEHRIITGWQRFFGDKYQRIAAR